MRRFLALFILGASVSLVACNNEEKAPVDVSTIMRDSSKFTTIEWLDTALDFGTAKKGEKVNLMFRCKNTGSKPLYLFDVRPGCGCTLVDYTKEAISPGKEGKIMAEYDSNKGVVGEIHKTVYVRSNNSNHARTYLTFSGMVINADSSVAAKK